MPKISVVVPVYKVEAYLDRCVESIVNQSFGDFDLYLVDDGSPDNCGAMCDAWAEKDSRICVIHQQNGGLSAARNSGIRKALAESDSQWITFIDSDDWIHQDTLNWLIQAAEEQNVSVSVCGFATTTGEDPWEGAAYNVQKWTAEDFYTGKFVNATVAWGKLYRKAAFETLTYPVGKLHEDEFTTYRLLFEAGEIAFVDAPLYAYFVNMSGITKTAWTPRRLHAWEAYEQQIAFFEQRGLTELVKFRYRGYLENAMVNLTAAQEEPEKYAAEIKFMTNRIRNVIRRAWKQGVIQFWIDYEMLYRFYPLLTKAYRFYLDKIR